MKPATSTARGTVVLRRSALETAGLVADGRAVLVDVREPEEWTTTGVAAPAHLLALGDLANGRKQWRPFLERNRDRELILYCLSGGRSAYAAGLLVAEGFSAGNMGRLESWLSAGLPIRHPNASEMP